MHILVTLQTTQKDLAVEAANKQHMSWKPVQSKSNTVCVCVSVMVLQGEKIVDSNSTGIEMCRIDIFITPQLLKQRVSQSGQNKQTLIEWLEINPCTISVDAVDLFGRWQSDGGGGDCGVAI